ncbi:MAG: hypothetical protein WCS31_11445 [Verrucomicrobiae bacterium]
MPDKKRKKSTVAQKTGSVPVDAPAEDVGRDARRPDMGKPAATSSIRRRRDHLSAMAERGTCHEKSIAKDKLKRLDARYDFGAPADLAPGDIFEGWDRPASSRQSHPVLKAKKEWLDAANLIKWVFQNKFKTSSGWRSLADGAELLLDAGKDDTARFKPFAKNLHATIVAACSEFSRGPAVSELERAPFLNGLYDGLMDEPRPAGTMMPGFSPVAKKKLPRRKKTAKSAPQAGTAATIHPYDIGRDAGKKLRVNIPRQELCEGIRLAVTAPG